MKLKIQFSNAFHIDLDTKKNGRFVKSFTEFKVNFDVLSHGQRSGILGTRSPVGQAWRSLHDSHEVIKGDTLKSVKYYIRPWIDSNGNWTRKTEGQFLILRKNHEILIKF